MQKQIEDLMALVETLKTARPVVAAQPAGPVLSAEDQAALDDVTESRAASRKGRA